MISLRPSKNYFTASLIVFLLSLLLLNIHNYTFANNCTYTWTQQSSGTSNLLYVVKTVNPFVCWAAGSNATVRKTTDGGATWINGNPNPGVITGNILCIEALDENNAWVSTSSQTNTFIYKTTNGGNTWVQVYTSFGGKINGIKMHSLTNGIALGDAIGTTWNIITTSNGGLNWMPLPTAPSSLIAESGFQNSFHVSQPNIWFGSSFGSVYRSTNNGATWSNHITPGINIYVLSVYFNSTNTGFAGSSGAMVKSTDAGGNYVQHSALGAGNIDNIDGINSYVWYVRGLNIYNSSDFGANWSLTYTAPLTLLDLDFTENETGCLTGWAVGYGGNIHKMTGVMVGIEGNNNQIPSSYSLDQNYPNPFNPSTNISFSLPVSGNTELKIYDLLGNEVSTLASSYMKAGVYNLPFDASNLASGVYIYKLTSGTFSESKRMALIK